MVGLKLSNRYEIVREIGRDGIGVVYLARDPLLERDVALKVIPSAVMAPDAAERFIREARAIADMDHPAISAIYDVGDHEGSIFFVMPLVGGATLRLLIRDGSLRLGDILDVGIQTADGLDYTHGRAIVHRDLRPENIVVSRGEGEGIRVRIKDFGLAKPSIESQLTRTTDEDGSPSDTAYLSPEQVSGGEIDARSDIYSLGTMLYECLAGVPPFTGDVQALAFRLVHEAPSRPSDLGVTIDPRLEDLVMACLAKDPSRRPQSAGDVRDALDSIRQQLDDAQRARIVGAGASHHDSGGQRFREHSPFVGRAREISELSRRLSLAVAGESHLVAVSGDAGIGKTRLLNEVERLARERGVRVLHGRFVEYDRSFPYQGFCDLIQEHFRSLESPAEGPDFSDLAPDLVELFPVLGEVPQLETEGATESSTLGTGEVRRLEDQTSVFELLARTVIRLTGGRPLVMLLEDLHGAEVSILALQYIVRRLGLAPILIVGTYRPSDVDRRHPLMRLIESFRGDRHFAAINVTELSPPEHRQMLEALFGTSALAPSMLETLYSSTEGNPFFTKELVRSLMDSGGVVADEEGRLSLLGDLGVASDALPATIQQVVERQLTRLPEELAEVLSVAAILGRSFEFRGLEAVVEGRINVEDAVERLVRLGFLEEREVRGDRLAFASRVVREVTYAGLSRRRRRTIHRKFATYLEQRYAGRLDRVYMQLLHHFSNGDVADKTVEYGFTAAVKALDAFAAEDAIAAVKTSLEFLEDEAWDGDRSIEGEARLLLAGAYRIQGNVHDALREAERGAAIFERESLPSQVLRSVLLSAEIAWEARRVDDTRRLVDRGLEGARALEERWALRRLLTLGATVANLGADYETARSFQDELEQLQPTTSERRRLPRGGRLVVALVSPILTAREPAEIQTADDEEILTNVFERLISPGSGGNIELSLAERLEMLDDGRGFLLTMRRDVYFSDGSPLTAHDVKYSFERAIRRNRENLQAVFAPIQGVSARTGALGEFSVDGLIVRSNECIEIRLDEPLPLYPALLADSAAAIVREHVASGATQPSIVGTGPFTLVEYDARHVVLERNHLYWGAPLPYLDAVEFLVDLDIGQISDGVRSGEIDLVRGEEYDTMERLTRDPRLHVSLVDAPRKDSCFLLFNTSSPVTKRLPLRRAMAATVRTQALVWQEFGRAAVPAVGLIPPGMLGSDPGRRQRSMTSEQALEMLRAAGITGETRIRCGVSPNFLERSADMFNRMFAAWAEIGVRVDVVTHTIDEYRAALVDASGLDMIVGRWTGDYDDPDNFTFGLFHSKLGAFRKFHASAELDQLAEQARGETRPEARESLYRKYETALLDAAVVVPLFHGADFRLASRGLRGLTLSSSAPFVNYSRIGRVSQAGRRGARPSRGGIIRVATSGGMFRNLDPALIVDTEKGEIIPNVFETLTRVVESARVVPWLAAEFSMEDDGRRFRFRLRDDVRFHDGRRLTARDVRYTFERLLQQTGANSHLLLPIRGARQLASGDVGDLEGFRIHSATEFSVELETPLPFFNVLLTNPCTAIVPEGCVSFDTTWREQCAGTGPFRVVSVHPYERVELERNPNYWREGYPKGEGLVFSIGLSSQEAIEEFRAGQLSLLTDLTPSELNALRHDPEFAARYFETPSLATAYLALNTKKGPLADVDVRRRVARAIDVESVVRRGLGRFALPALGMIPPGLLGHDPSARQLASQHRTPPGGERRYLGVSELTFALARSVLHTLSPLIDQLSEALKEHDIRLRVRGLSHEELIEARETCSVDMALSVWVLDFPDTDSLFTGLLHSQEGVYGRMSGSPEVDQLIEQARTELSVGMRHSIYRNIENVNTRDALGLALFHPPNYRFARPELEGLVCTSLSYPVVAYEELRIR